MKKYAKSPALNWQHISLIVLCTVLGIVLAALLSATAYVNHMLGMITSDPDNNSGIHGTLPPDQMATATEDPTIPSGEGGGSNSDANDPLSSFTPADKLNVDGVVNIMLIGEDRRPGEGRQRSDSMILCSFNTNTNTINMISFLRDTYVIIPDHNGNKLNAPYQWGGVELLDRTMELNFGVQVDANVVVNFEGFKGIIDMLGGVDISLTAAEAEHLNGLHGWSLSAGLHHLNGEEALAYSRIRKIDWDINRTQRQRNVLISLINAFKDKSIGTMSQIATNILQSGYIQTDMSSTQLLSYIAQLAPMFATAPVKNYHIPALNTFEDMDVGNLVDVKVCDMNANRAILKKIFGIG